MLSFKEQLELVDQGLATVKVDGHLSTFKYHRKVMYEYLWSKHPKLLECRGHVYDNRDGTVVQAAPRKSFNFLENNWWSGLPPTTPVRVYKKINGYMACATLHRGELVVSTTGSTTSEYAQWARELILKDYKLHSLIIEHDSTCLFEVVLPQDPHIVEERIGLHYLGNRCKATGDFHPMRNLAVTEMTLRDALNLAKTDKGEGFMVYRVNDTYNQYPCKLKTPYYAGKKKLMRLSKSNVELMYRDPKVIKGQIDFMWDAVVDRVLADVPKQVWLETPEQTRRSYLENFYESQYKS